MKLLDYNIIKNIGRGAYGTVELVEHKKTKEQYALKTIRINSNDKLTNLLNEIKIMKNLNSKHLIRIIDWEQTDDIISILMEWAKKGDLDDLIQEHKKANKFIDTKLVDRIIYQTACGLKELHQNKIIHRDIKPSNILIFDDNTIKLADFGISKLLLNEDKAYTQIGTPFYMSPEVVNGYAYTYSNDYWSLGCVYYQLITLTKPFDSTNLLSLFMKILDCSYDYTKIPNKYKKLIKNLIQKDKNQRYDHRQIFNFYIRNCLK